MIENHFLIGDRVLQITTYWNAISFKYLIEEDGMIHIRGQKMMPIEVVRKNLKMRDDVIHAKIMEVREKAWQPIETIYKNYGI